MGLVNTLYKIIPANISANHNAKIAKNRGGKGRALPEKYLCMLASMCWLSFIQIPGCRASSDLLLDVFAVFVQDFYHAFY